VATGLPTLPTLLADIGGTNARFALSAEAPATALIDSSIRDYRVRDFASLAAAAQHYQHELGVVSRQAVMAVAGRVDGDSIQMTNHHWQISIASTRSELALEALEVINDFKAMALAVPMIGPQQIVPVGPVGVLTSPLERAATWAVIGPGTGLGVAALLRRDGRYQVVETEAGHSGFAPCNGDELALLGQLQKSFGRVSNERLISGAGLRHIYQALCALAGREAEVLSPEQISARAATCTDPQCVQTMETFAAVFGAIAGDSVLNFGAWDGIYLSGGMLPTLLPWLQRGRFRERFEDKGRFRSALQNVPTLAIVHPQPGLLGAAVAAAAIHDQRHGDR